MPQIKNLMSVVSTSIIFLSDPSVFVLESPQAASAQSQSVATLTQQGINALEAKEFKEAELIWRRVLKLEPNNSDAYFNLGVSLGQQGKLKEAITAYRRSIQLAPSDAIKHREFAAFLGGRGGDLKEALVLARRAVQLDPKDSTAYWVLGLVLSLQDNAREAIAAYRRSIQLNPRGVEGYSLLASELDKQGNYEGAISNLRQAVRLAPNDKQLQGLLKQWERERMLRIFNQPQPTSQSPSSNPGLDTSIGMLVQQYKTASQNLQRAENEFQTCRFTSSSPLSCPSTGVVSYRNSMIGFQNAIIRILMSAKEKTFVNPRLCGQTINAYQRVLAAGIPVVGMAQVQEFCRNRG